MENKKLVKILLKDVGELEEMIAEMKSNRQFDALTVEFIHSRAKGVLQVLQMLELKGMDAGKVSPEPENNSVEPSESPQDMPPVQDENSTDEEIMEGPAVNPPDSWEVSAEPLHASVESYAEEKNPMSADEEEGAEEDKPESADEAEGDEEYMLEEELHLNAGNARLGDSFLKGRSINDLITEQQKLEFKLSNRPISSIQSAIGINDRFQFIRELFDGDNEKFLETVKNLDTMENIHDAVSYLRTRFKWKKNETSLKFVNLVKRRFLNA